MSARGIGSIQTLSSIWSEDRATCDKSLASRTALSLRLAGEAALGLPTASHGD